MLEIRPEKRNGSYSRPIPDQILATKKERNSAPHRSVIPNAVRELLKRMFTSLLLVRSLTTFGMTDPNWVMMTCFI